MQSWVSVPQQSLGSIPQSGQSASMDAAGLAGAAASGNLMEVEAFVVAIDRQATYPRRDQ